ncbi:MAG: hypothetical protein ABSB95_05465 [Dissulfurispiraceae bacterium]|jgi:hypothetical protein
MRTKAAELARTITETLLKGGPDHIKAPQIEELSKLTIKQLLALTKIESFPMPTELREELVKEVVDAGVIARIETRREFVQAILEAERDNAYEITEHLAGTSDPYV